MFGVAFSPDGKQLATSDSGGTVRLWNPATGRPAGPSIQTGTANPSGGGVEPRRQAAGHRDIRRHGPAVEPGHRPGPGPSIQTGVNPVLGVAFSPDGKQLATADYDGTVRLWNPATGQPATLRVVAVSGAAELAFSPDGKQLATGEFGGTVRLWNPATGRPAAAHPDRHATA